MFDTHTARSHFNILVKTSTTFIECSTKWLQEPMETEICIDGHRAKLDGLILQSDPISRQMLFEWI